MINSCFSFSSFSLQVSNVHGNFIWGKNLPITGKLVFRIGSVNANQLAKYVWKN